MFSFLVGIIPSSKSQLDLVLNRYIPEQPFYNFIPITNRLDKDIFENDEWKDIDWDTCKQNLITRFERLLTFVSGKDEK